MIRSCGFVMPWFLFVCVCVCKVCSSAGMITYGHLCVLIYVYALINVSIVVHFIPIIEQALLPEKGVDNIIHMYV